MQERYLKLKRLAAVQRQMERVAEVELAEVMRERAAVADRMEALADALASPNPVHAGFSRVYGAQIGRLKVKDQILNGRMQLQQKRLMSERAKADKLDESTESARSEVLRLREEMELEQMLECIGASAAQASRKFRGR